MKNVFITLLFLSAIFLAGCKPNEGTKDDKEAVKSDTIDHRQGAGEGEEGVGAYGQ